MSLSSILVRSAALALAFSAAPSIAQEVVQPLPGTTDADKLGDYMRRIGANPRDVPTLVDAGELSLRLGDSSGAASLFARAEKIDPRNARVKAGQGAILVRAERPAEALRYFQQAEALGLAPRVFASDRGLAYDLLGEQERAQRDYRLALGQRADDDETITRYALSLGIAGKREQALAQLDPLVRKSDRGAWRARAFVLAMAGDQAGATKIATTMMPPGMAQGLRPFFDRLPTLPAVDRAFAVHFGETRPTAERIADARLKPALPPLDPEAASPVMVAQAQPAPLPAAMPSPVRPTQRDRRGRQERTQVAAAVPAPVAPVDTTPPPPTYQPPVDLAKLDPLPGPTRRTSRGVSAAAQANAQQLAALGPSTTVSVAGASRVAPASTVIPSATGQQLAALTPRRAAETVNRAVATTPLVPRATAPTSAPMGASASAPAPGFEGTASAPTSAATVERVASVPPPAAGSASVPATQTAAVAPAPVVTSPVATSPATKVASTVQSVAVAPAPIPAAPRHMSEDSILARIVAGISIPASELGVEGPERTSPTPSPVVAAAQPVSNAAEQALEQAKAAADARAAEKARADKLAATKAAADKRIADKKAAEKKAADARQALADKKAAAEKKEAAEKKAAELKEARANPSRIWVQVATGANEGDLPKAWARVKAKSAESFAGKRGWTTPLRATNRVLAGPFKTDEDARAFVNALAKKGISASPFTSDKGQKVARLDSE